MAQSRTYNVTVYPALITDVGFMTEPLGPQARFSVDAAGFDALDAAVNARLPEFAARLPAFDNVYNSEGSDGFAVTVSVPRGARKPAGFDRRYRSPRQVRLAEVASAEEVAA